MKAAPLHSGHGWLAGVVPDGATRFRVADGALATTLAHAGGQLVEREPEVELGPAEWASGDADVCIVPLGASKLDVDWRVQRAVSRVAVSLRVHAQAERARRILRRRGYQYTKVLLWDVGQPLRTPGTKLDGQGLVGRLPQRATVVAARRPLGQTVLEAIIGEAASQAGFSLHPGPATVREGLLVVPATDGILRLGIGPATLHLDRQFAFLTRLKDEELPPSVRELIPWPLGRGRRGLVNWSVERRLPGRMPRPQLEATVVADCLDFLVDLHGATACAPPAQPDGVVADARVVANVCGAEEADALARLAERVERRLADLPRGFGHGDFYRGNLLVDGDRLVGVVDWDTAAPSSLPYLDLFHLRVFSEHRPADHRWGAVVTEHLLPLAQAGGDGLMREYSRRIGVDPSRAELEALVVAYWLHRLAHQLETVADRFSRERWLDENVRRAARVLADVNS